MSQVSTGRWSVALILAAALAACTAPLNRETRPSLAWPSFTPASPQTSEFDRFTDLAAKFPNSSAVQRRLLTAAVATGNATAARAALARLDEMGQAPEPELMRSAAPLIGEAETAAAEARAAQRRRQIGSSTIVETASGEFRLIEGLAWDLVSQRLYLSSVVDRALVLMDKGVGRAVPGIDGGSLTALAVDAPRRLMWMGSGRLEESGDSASAFVGLIGMDLDTQKVVHRVAGPPEAKTLSDLGVASDGTVFVSDTIGGGIYRLRPGLSVIDVAVPPGVFRNPQGIAVRPDGKRLYLSDYPFGIAIVNLSGSVERLTAAPNIALDGFDGLYWHEGALIGIQNGVSPRRIVRLRLDRSGKHVTAVDVIEANNPEWGEPTLGQIVDDDLLYVSDPQWERFGPEGAIKGEGPLRPNRIRRVRLK